VLDGELVIKLKKGQEYTLGPRTSFQVADDEANPHLASNPKGAEVFIVD
jgi:hypothetical protein